MHRVRLDRLDHGTPGPRPPGDLRRRRPGVGGRQPADPPGHLPDLRDRVGAWSTASERPWSEQWTTWWRTRGCSRATSRDDEPEEPVTDSAARRGDECARSPEGVAGSAPSSPRGWLRPAPTWRSADATETAARGRRRAIADRYGVATFGEACDVADAGRRRRVGASHRPAVRPARHRRRQRRGVRAGRSDRPRRHVVVDGNRRGRRRRRGGPGPRGRAADASQRVRTAARPVGRRDRGASAARPGLGLRRRRRRRCAPWSRWWRSSSRDPG